jgi:hypothetical protein
VESCGNCALVRIFCEGVALALALALALQISGINCYYKRGRLRKLRARSYVLHDAGGSRHSLPRSTLSKPRISLLTACYNGYMFVEDVAYSRRRNQPYMGGSTPNRFALHVQPPGQRLVLVQTYQYLCGERASLKNYGFIQIVARA